MAATMDTPTRLAARPADRSAARPAARITIRELTTDDAPRVEGLFHRMSDRSRYLRFASPAPRLTHRLRRHLTGMDGRGHIALGAFADGELVGTARYIRLADDRAAEFAIAVADSHHGRGIGRRLLRALLDTAARRGLQRLTFTALPENDALLALATSLGARYRINAGLAEGHIPV